MKTLKIAISSLFFVLCLITSCSKSNNTAQEEALRTERDSLQTLANTNRLELERMTEFFNEVAACIDSINEQEVLLTSPYDIETNRRYSQQEIAMRLNQLSDIIIGQRERISALMDSLNKRTDTLRISGLRNTISYLTNQLAVKETQIKRLQAEIGEHKKNIRLYKDQVEHLNTEVGNLTSQNNALVEAVQAQTEIINEGYILVGTKDDLKAMGIIEGGGLFKKSKTNLGNIRTSQCNKVNISTFRELPLHSKKITLLSPAPASSYTIRKNGDMTTLVINDATAFWSLSNILVIQIQ
ncbi:MAG: hypothetical protein K2M72_08855 [Paramuribaculum sp.]|nr:hypothetical protein [Paramuribaculum sp.]